MQTDEERRKWCTEKKKINEFLAETKAALENATQKHKEHLTKKKLELAEAREELREEKDYRERKLDSIEDMRIELVRKQKGTTKMKCVFFRLLAENQELRQRQSFESPSKTNDSPCKTTDRKKLLGKRPQNNGKGKTKIFNTPSPNKKASLWLIMSPVKCDKDSYKRQKKEKNDQE